MHPNAFGKLDGALTDNFFEPDLQAQHIVLGTIATHYLPFGDPAWLFVIAPPGAGKTTTAIMPAYLMPNAHILSDITENTFLSGFYGHENPGLLEKGGSTTKNGDISITNSDPLLLFKDFTTVLEMRRDKRGVILSQLREIHDGQFSRRFGTGETKIWNGRATVVAAVTPVLDRYYSIFGVLGERFMQLRIARPRAGAAKAAIKQQGKELAIRQQVVGVIADLFQQAKDYRQSKALPSIPAAVLDQLCAMAELLAIARTHVMRDGSNRDVEYVPEPEASTRIAKGLAAMARGITWLHCKDEVTPEIMVDVERVAKDCLPELRRELIFRHNGNGGTFLDDLPHPKTTVERAVEDLSLLGIGVKMCDSFVLNAEMYTLLHAGFTHLTHRP